MVALKNGIFELQCKTLKKFKTTLYEIGSWTIKSNLNGLV